MKFLMIIGVYLLVSAAAYSLINVFDLAHALPPDMRVVGGWFAVVMGPLITFLLGFRLWAVYASSSVLVLGTAWAGTQFSAWWYVATAFAWMGSGYVGSLFLEA